MNMVKIEQPNGLTYTERLKERTGRAPIIDAWTLAHFLCGFGLAGFGSKSCTDMERIAITTIGMSGFEIIEHGILTELAGAGGIEYADNVASDIVAGVVGGALHILLERAFLR